MWYIYRASKKRAILDICGHLVGGVDAAPRHVLDEQQLENDLGEGEERLMEDGNIWYKYTKEKK